MTTPAQIRELVRDVHDGVQEVDRSNAASSRVYADVTRTAAAVVAGDSDREHDGGVAAGDRARAYGDAQAAVVRETDFQAAGAGAVGNAEASGAAATGTAIQSLEQALAGSPDLPAPVRQAANEYLGAVRGLNDSIQQQSRVAGELARAESVVQEMARSPHDFVPAATQAATQAVQAASDRLQATNLRVDAGREALDAAEDHLEQAVGYDTPDPVPAGQVTQPAPAPASPTGEQFAVPEVHAADAVPAAAPDAAGSQFAVRDHSPDFVASAGGAGPSGSHDALHGYVMNEAQGANRPFHLPPDPDAHPSPGSQRQPDAATPSAAAQPVTPHADPAGLQFASGGAGDQPAAAPSSAVNDAGSSSAQHDDAAPAPVKSAPPPDDPYDFPG